MPMPRPPGVITCCDGPPTPLTGPCRPTHTTTIASNKPTNLHRNAAPENDQKISKNDSKYKPVDSLLIRYYDILLKPKLIAKSVVFQLVGPKSKRRLGASKEERYYLTPLNTYQDMKRCNFSYHYKHCYTPRLAEPEFWYQ